MLNRTLYNEVSIFPDMPGYFKRPKIHTLLEDLMQKSLITVIAGAGFGKTYEVSSFLREYDAISIWLQLSSLDNMITRMWDHLVYAVSVKNEGLSAKLALLGFPNSIATFNKLLDLIAKEMKPGEKYIVVLDDFHLIYDKAIIQFVEDLVCARVTGLSVILISRSEPAINTAGLYSQGLLTGITEDDLRFQKSEMDEYFKVQGIQLSGQASSNIWHYADGWIFAIYLIGLSLKKGIAYEASPISAIRSDIFKLIQNEIFSVVSEDVQRFLVKLSLVSNLPSALLKELSSGNPSFITEIEKIGSFIRCDVFSNTYLMHNLFLEFLTEKQDMLKQDEIVETHIKAARWYANNGHKIDAILHYEKINHFDGILDIIRVYSGRCSAETANFIINVLDKIPSEFYRKNPIIKVYRAKFLLNNFQIEESYAELITMKEKYESLPPTKENTAILGETYTILGLISLVTSFVTRTYEYKHLFKLASECLPGGSIVAGQDVHLNAGAYVCMIENHEKGELERFQEAISYTIPYLSSVMSGCAYGMDQLTMAEIAYHKRKLKDAEKYAQQAICQSQTKGQYDMENMSIFYLIRINVALGNYSKIFELLERLRLQSERLNGSDCFIMNDIIEGFFYSLIGQTRKVAGWIMDEIESKKVMSPITFALDKLVRARCYLAQQKYYELLAFLGQDSQEYGLKNYLFGAIETKVLKTVALYRIQEVSSAIATLQEAYDLAAPNLLDMPFIEYGSNMRAITQVAINDDHCTIPKEWLEKIYTKSSTYAKRLTSIVSEYEKANNRANKQQPQLTKRELEILSYICFGMTREEIAADCNLSVNTIKSKLQNIYNKLGATNTFDAVRIATSMELIK